MRQLKSWAKTRVVKAEARAEVLTGTLSARDVEGVQSTPYQRAQFAVNLEQFRASYAPQHPAEDLMVQQMAVSFESYPRWQSIAAERAEQGEWAAMRAWPILWETMTERERDRYAREQGYLPTRISHAEAIEQATVTAERYLRSFRGLLRTFQQMRNRLGTGIMTGGQLSMADRPMVMLPASTPD